MPNDRDSRYDVDNRLTRAIGYLQEIESDLPDGSASMMLELTIELLQEAKRINKPGNN